MREVLEAVAAGELSPTEAEGRLMGYVTTDAGRFDAAREQRRGAPEGILAEGKTPAEVADDLVAYEPVRTALEEAGGPPAFDVPEDDGYERQETIRF